MRNEERLVLMLALLAAAGMASLAMAAPVETAKPPEVPSDAVCWVTPECAVPRGGDADVLTIYKPDGSVLTQLFAFGHEQGGHVYYFDPALVPVDLQRFGHYTALLESDGRWSEAVGIFKVPGRELALGFTDHPEKARSFAGEPDQVFFERADLANPVPLVGTSGGDYLSVPYDATRFLSEAWRAQGYRAELRTAAAGPAAGGAGHAVPEPGTLGLVGLGLSGVLVSRHGREKDAAAPRVPQAASRVGPA